MENENQEPMRVSTKWAIGVTVVWLLGIAAYVGWKWCEFVVMPPNSLGDFLAGTMSPLALFWLVAGYRQQGEELSLNTEALKAQLKELALQVEATKDMGSSAKKQAEIAEENHKFEKQKFEYAEAEKKEAYKRKIQPLLNVKYYHEVHGTHNFRLFNNGGDAYDVKLERKDGENIELSGDDVKFKNDTERTISTFMKKEFIDAFFEFTVKCLDEDKYPHEFNFMVVADNKGEVFVTEEPTPKFS